MIDEALIQQPRTPSELRAFVLRVHGEVASSPDELHKGMLKKGLYKVFLDEIVPLSRFAAAHYSDDLRVQSVLGNQAYDALVIDRNGAIVDKVEMTFPQDGAANASNTQLVINRGYGELECYGPGDDVRALAALVTETARKKSTKDYSDCTLVIVLKTLPPFDSFQSEHDAQIECVVAQLRTIQFKTKSVFLLVMPDQLIRVYGSGR